MNLIDADKLKEFIIQLVDEKILFDGQKNRIDDYIDENKFESKRPIIGVSCGEHVGIVGLQHLRAKIQTPIVHIGCEAPKAKFDLYQAIDKYVGNIRTPIITTIEPIYCTCESETECHKINDKYICSSCNKPLLSNISPTADDISSLHSDVSDNTEAPENKSE